MQGNSLNEYRSLRPPIPSPFESAMRLPRAPREPRGRASRTARSPSLLLNYTVMSGVALLAGIVEFTLVSRFSFEVVATLVMCLYYCGALCATLSVVRAAKEVDGPVTPEHLPLVRRTVDRNMKCAFVMLTTIWPLMIVAMVIGSFVFALPLLVLSIPLSLWSKRVETRFKAMEVHTAAQAEFGQILQAWKEARFGLRNDVAQIAC